MSHFKEVIINSEAEMVEFGKELSTQLSAGSVVALVGEVGAGKTHLTKGLGLSMGYAEIVSPTFTIVNENVGQDLGLYHFDFYRLRQVEELWDLGWEDYLDKKGVIVAEWADMYPEVFPAETLWIKVAHEGSQRRLMIKELP